MKLARFQDVLVMNLFFLNWLNRYLYQEINQLRLRSDNRQFPQILPRLFQNQK